MSQYSYEKNYKDNDGKRNAFLSLIKKQFGLDLENWYQDGHWKEQYNPHTLFDEEKAISSVSTYEMIMDFNGDVENWVQIGGVVTEEAYRNQGLCRKVLEHVLEEYEDKVDTIFLLANHTVTEFYPKFGFHLCKQWQCEKDVHIEGKMTAVPFSMEEKENQDIIKDALRTSFSNSQLELKRDPELLILYLTEFMKENVYFIEELQAYVVAEIQGAELIVNQVIAPEKIDLDKVYEAFGHSIQHVTLGFTPLETQSYTETEITDPDDNLFVMGDALEKFRSQQVMVPVLAHT